MLKVTINYRREPDSTWDTDESYLVDTDNHITAAITANQKFQETTAQHKITSVYVKQDVEVLTPVNWALQLY